MGNNGNGVFWENRIISHGMECPMQLLGNPLNARIHPKKQQDALAGSLDEVGFVQAVIVNKRTSEQWGDQDRNVETMVDGHLRAQMAISKGQPEIPVVYVDLTPNEEAKVLATLDPIGAMAAVDGEKLDLLLREIDTGDEALQSLLAEMAEDAGLDYFKEDVPEAPEPEVDRAEELREKWKTERGQLWVIEGKHTHRLLCGDATIAGDVERLLAGTVPFIMVTDPPYGVEHNPHWREEAGVSTFGPQATGLVENDDRIDWTETYSLFPGHVAYVWHAGRHAAEVVQNLHEARFEIRTQVIWRKPMIVFGRGHYHWQHEPCWYAVRKGGSAKWCGDRKQSTVWEIASMHVMGGARNKEGDEVTGHSTQKPVECMARPIRNHGDKDDDVFDPFLGSGTTMVAAQQLNRRCYGIEISPAYCAVILERMTAMDCTCTLAK